MYEVILFMSLIGSLFWGKIAVMFDDVNGIYRHLRYFTSIGYEGCFGKYTVGTTLQLG